MSASDDDDQMNTDGREDEGFDASESEKEDEKAVETSDATFASLGVCAELVTACGAQGWKLPTPIQRQALPWALQGRDIIGLAETGSGKTGAFAIPVIQALLAKPQSAIFACCITPTRELAFQISEQFESLGAGVGLRCAVLVGGIDMMTQALALGKKPHIVVGTPGRIIDHLENTKGFTMRDIKFLVLDEADRILTQDFEQEVDKILAVIPKERRTFLFSATMTSKVQKLQRASLKNPVKVEVSHKYSTPSQLIQNYLFIPAKFKDCYLAFVLNELAGQSTMVFTGTCNTTQRVALMLRHLGFSAIPIHGKLSQSKRLGALNKFKAGSRNILIATDVASRGLDIPNVDLVVNFDVPLHSKDYVHRVGRTARAGKAGRSITMVTQYDVELLQRIEALLGKQLDQFPTEESSVLLLAERVSDAQRFATTEMKETGFNVKSHPGAGGDEEGDGTDALATAVGQKRKRDGERRGDGRGGGRGSGRGGGGGRGAGRKGGPKRGAR